MKKSLSSPHLAAVGDHVFTHWVQVAVLDALE